MAFIRYVRAILVIKFPELFAHAESESKLESRMNVIDAHILPILLYKNNQSMKDSQRSY